MNSTQTEQKVSKQKIARQPDKRTSSSSQFSADERKMLEIVGNLVADDLGGKPGLLKHIAEMSEDESSRDDPVGQGAWLRWVNRITPICFTC